jgi:hypothetical protein
MDQPDAQPPPTAQTEQPDLDPTFKAQVQRLHQLTVYGRWLVVVILWITLGSLSLWGWRYELSLLRSHFTWSAVRYGIFFNPLPALGLALCIAMSVSVLVWQSRNILLGNTTPGTEAFRAQVHRICQQGASHPLWKWVCKPPTG